MDLCRVTDDWKSSIILCFFKAKGSRPEGRHYTGSHFCLVRLSTAFLVLALIKANRRDSFPQKRTNWFYIQSLALPASLQSISGRDFFTTLSSSVQFVRCERSFNRIWQKTKSSDDLYYEPQVYSICQNISVCSVEFIYYVNHTSRSSELNR